MKNKILLFIFLFCSYPIFAQNGYNIKIKIKNLKNKPVILAHYFNKQMIPDDTAFVNANGVGVFKGKKKLPGGMYLLYLPTRNYFDILLDKDQNFSIENDTVKFLDNMKITGSLDNQLFVDYQKIMREKRKAIMPLQKEKKTANETKNKKTEATKTAKRKEKKKLETEIKNIESNIKEIDKKIRQIDKELREVRDKVIKENPKSFFATFLRATKYPEVPEPPKDDKGNITDSLFQYKYYKNHFWDDFNPADPRLLRTPLYQDKIDHFLDKSVFQIPDTIILEVDNLIKKSRGNDELFRFMLVHLFNKYATSQIISMEKVYVHIAEKYYIPEATWSKGDFKDKTKERIRKKKNCLMGNVSREMKMIALPHDTTHIKNLKDALTDLKERGGKIMKDSSKTKDQRIEQTVPILNEYMHLQGDYASLHSSDADYILMWFWEPSCSHCREATPHLIELYNKLKSKGVKIKVYSVFLQGFIEDWGKFTKHIKDWYDFIIKYKLQDWTNAWDPYHHTQFREYYDIASSPVSFILDKDRKIVAKRIGVEQIKEFFEFELKKKNKK